MGIEPITYHLQGGCSTIELRRRPENIFLLMFYQDYIVYQKWRACARLYNSPSIPKKEFIRGIPNSQAFPYTKTVHFRMKINRNYFITCRLKTGATSQASW